MRAHHWHPPSFHVFREGLETWAKGRRQPPASAERPWHPNTHQAAHGQKRPPAEGVFKTAAGGAPNGENTAGSKLGQHDPLQTKGNFPRRIYPAALWTQRLIFAVHGTAEMPQKRPPTPIKYQTANTRRGMRVQMAP